MCHSYMLRMYNHIIMYIIMHVNVRIYSCLPHTCIHTTVLINIILHLLLVISLCTCVAKIVYNAIKKPVFLGNFIVIQNVL